MKWTQEACQTAKFFTLSLQECQLTETSQTPHLCTTKNLKSVALC